jgi:hypothetical protein
LETEVCIHFLAPGCAQHVLHNVRCRFALDARFAGLQSKAPSTPTNKHIRDLLTTTTTSVDLFWSFRSSLQDLPTPHLQQQQVLMLVFKDGT